MLLRRLQVGILLLLIPLGALYLYAENNDTTIREMLFPGSQVMHIGDIPVNVEVADTPELRMMGLSGREEIENVNGLLFIFDEPRYHGIWMKDMKFAIDVIWISEDKEVIGITRNLRPESYPQVFEPPRPVLYAVETNPHFSDTFGIRVGDPVRLPGRYE